MSTEVKIPAVGESITSGLISVWHKNDGETVAAGEVLLTLETDKVSTEITAEKVGILKILIPQGEEVKIGAVVATIEDSGNGVAAAPAPARESAAIPEAVPQLAAEPKSQPEPVKTAESTASLIVSPVPFSAALAASRQIEVQEPSVPKAAIQAGVEDARTTRKKMSPLRRKIAAQLVMAQQTAAILTTFNECDMSAVMDLRSRMQDSFTKEYGVKLGFMSFFIKATVKALKAVPSINSRIDGEDLILNHFYDIGVAVGTERGLIVPVIRNADQKNFAEIERDILLYAGKAREGKIKVEDLQGGVFSISNGGVYGSLMSTPILNPPQSGILGLHKILERPIAVKGQVVIRPMMNLALSYDHRVVDGKEAVTFLIKVKESIEDPMRLLLEV
jgi:2-oxoglutarate dehydrogenase E2 component (dihydrolipoamide succinyltransferase)